MILKKISRLFPKEIKTELFFLYFLMVFAALLEFISLGLIPIFISYIISDSLDNFYIDLNVETLLNFITGENITIKISIIIFLVFLFKFFYMIFLSYYELKIIRKIKLFFSENIYSAYVDKGYNFFIKKNTSELGRNIINEIENAVQFIVCILSISKELLLIFVIGTLLVLFDPLVSLLGIFIISFFVLIFYFKTDSKLKNIAKKRVKLFADIFKHVIETFSIIKEIKIYSKESFFIKQFINIRKSLEFYLFKRDFLIKLPKIVFEFLAVSLIIFLIVIFTVLNKSSTELFTLLSLLAVAVVRLLPSFNQLSVSLTHFGSYKISFEILGKEIDDFLSNKKFNNNFGDSKKEQQSVNFDTEILIDKVYFSYDDNEQAGLNNISLEVKKGEMIGLIGRSGAGKSTLVNIILKLLKPQKGQVVFRNKKVSCGYVPQDIFLLDSSLKANIALAEDNVDEEKLMNVIKRCELDNFVKTHKKGVNLILGERGIRISGGEKQRIGLARALYSNNKIIILDEATSALDNQTENNIMNSILKLKHDLTIILVAHRLSTLKHCDRVIYLENGYIKDQGKLEFLLSKYPDLDIKNKVNN